MKGYFWELEKEPGMFEGLVSLNVLREEFYSLVRQLQEKWVIGTQKTKQMKKYTENETTVISLIV